MTKTIQPVACPRCKGEPTVDHPDSYWRVSCRSGHSLSPVTGHPMKTKRAAVEQWNLQHGGAAASTSKAPVDEKPRIVPAEVAPGRDVRRRPGGRGCNVVELNEDRTKVLVRDGSTSTWVNMSTLVEKWY